MNDDWHHDAQRPGRSDHEQKAGEPGDEVAPWATDWDLEPRAEEHHSAERGELPEEGHQHPDDLSLQPGQEPQRDVLPEEQGLVTTGSDNDNSTPPATQLAFERVEKIRIDDGLPVDRTPSELPKRTRPPAPRRRHHPDPLTQSLTVLATIAVMLLAARFVVPRVVEEIRYAWHRGELRAEYESGTDGLKNVSLDALSDAYEMVTAAVGPSVVHIDVQRRPSLEAAGLPHLLGDSFLPITDQGSGVVVDGEGFVLTNQHVIAEGEDITVTLSDGRQVMAVVIGTDAETDLAVLKIDADRLMPIQWGDSDRCRVGSPVWAVGSPFGLDRTVTFGILSGKHRMVRASTQYQDFMQSDVAVNPGNSGGPLVDARGTLIGINTAIVGDTYRGVSFSIPSNVAQQVYRQIRKTGRVERGWLGVSLNEVAYDPQSDGDPRVRGASVERLYGNNSPAALAGLQAGDRILAVDDNPVRNIAHLMRLIGDSIAGSQVKLGVERDAQKIEITVQLGARSDAPLRN